MADKLQLVVVEPNSSGGLIHYTYQLCTALANEELDVTLLTGADYEMQDLPHNFSVNNMLQLWTLFDSQNIQTLDAGFLQRASQKIFKLLRRGIRAARLISAWINMTRYLIRLKPDMILFSRVEFPFEAFFYGYLRRRGLILSQICHEFELRESGGFLSPLITRTFANAYTHFSAIFFHARENQQRFLSLFPAIDNGKTHVIPHGNSGWLLTARSDPGAPDALKKKYGLKDSERVVLFFGLLAPSKGVEDLIEAFALARQSCDAKLVIAGYPTKHIDVNDFKTRIAKLNLENYVVLDLRYIPLEELGALISLANVVVYPYRSSTQSGALQVAYTFGRPVIATAVGGLPEAVEDGKSGFLVPVQSPAELAKKIVTLINNPQLASQMGTYARHLSETRFSWREAAKQIATVYENLPDRK